MQRLRIERVVRPLRDVFTISRGSKTTAETITVTLEAEGARGRGECVPYARYGESLDSVVAQIEAVRAAIEGGVDRAQLTGLLPSGAARNAVDCALWDLEAKQTGQPVHLLAGRAPPEPVLTAYTLSVATPEAMAEAARKAADRPLLKLKAGGAGDIDRIKAVREAVPQARLIVDANEAWLPEDVEPRLEAFAELGVEMVEQPLPAGQDHSLSGIDHRIILCADESFHDRTSFPEVLGRYGMVNVKLDKTGGLTEALAAIDEARAHGLQVMVGCMVAGSLAMAPAFLAAQGAEIVDLDGPLLLGEDEPVPLTFRGSLIEPPAPPLWG
ncbi:MAG: N-acetyl-D-Glu racemase DgcA [Pseudomonadota bacterium]